MMLKSFVATVSAAILASLFPTAAAHAGCGGGHGGYSARASYSTPSPTYAAKLRAKRAAEAGAIAAAKRQKSIEIAKARAAAKAIELADTSKPAPAKAETAEIETKDAAPMKVAATPSTCRKFIPAIGTTAEVPCSVE
jgi:hypothetical protein